MSPDFNKNIVETIAKRASYICSNPDCQVKTVGPNSDVSKSTTIGEAAHIYGARPNSKRYTKEMTDASRAAITNAIWLCRNCHKQIDTDESRYTPATLFRWRELHESFILSELGNKTDQINGEQLNDLLTPFNSYPPIIKRIVIDRPKGWEYRLTAELQRHLNKSGFRKLRDLKNNLYLKSVEHITDEKAFDWIQLRVAEMSQIISPATNLVNEMTNSWGEPGQAGDVDEIHHVSLLIRDYLDQVVRFEESIRFANLPESCERIQELLGNAIASQVLKLESIPDRLDKIITNVIDNSDIETAEPVHETITFELPDDLAKEFDIEIRKLLSRQN